MQTTSISLTMLSQIRESCPKILTKKSFPNDVLHKVISEEKECPHTVST